MEQAVPFTATGVGSAVEIAGAASATTSMHTVAESASGAFWSTASGRRNNGLAKSGTAEPVAVCEGSRVVPAVL